MRRTKAVGELREELNKEGSVRVISNVELLEILKQHEGWIKSGGERGAKAVFHRVGFTSDSSKLLNRLNLMDAKFSHCIFLEVKFFGCDLYDVLFESCIFNGCSFDGCRMIWTKFQIVELISVKFFDCSMRGVGFHHTEMIYDTEFDLCTMNGVGFLAVYEDESVEYGRCHFAGIEGKRLLSVGNIGRRDGVTDYDAERDVVTCGCFRGTLSKFRAAVRKTHKPFSKHRREYMGAIKVFKASRREFLKKGPADQ